MHAWEAIQKTIDYIETNYADEINIELLSNIASLSPYYFQRLFGRLIGKPVMEYIKLRRLAKATEELKHKNNRIIDIALDCGFSDHANFTRAFREAYDITPEEYSSHPVILDQFVKPNLSLDYSISEEDIPLITEGMVVEVTRKHLEEIRNFIGIMYEVPVSELTDGKTTGISVAGTIWSDFHRHKSSIPNLLENGNECGFLYLDKNTGSGCYTYSACAEVNAIDITEGFTSFQLLCGEYVVCRFQAENFAELVGSAIFKASSFMKNWISKHNLTCGKFVTEMYFDTSSEANYMELWLPINKSRVKFKKDQYWNKNDETSKPTKEAISAYVNHPLWEQLCNYVETEYQCKPVLEFSKCSMQFGWNVKYKKGGRTLCTLYPMEGYYIVLIVIGLREQTEFEFMLPTFTEYLQQLYHETKSGMCQKWLMISVTDGAVLEDVKQCITIRRGIRKK